MVHNQNRLNCPNCGKIVVSPIPGVVKCTDEACKYSIQVFSQNDQKSAEEFYLMQPSKRIKYLTRVRNGCWLVASCDKAEPFIADSLSDLIDPSALQMLQVGLSRKLKKPVTIIMRFNNKPTQEIGPEYPVQIIEKEGHIFGRIDPIDPKAYYCKRCEEIRRFTEGERTCLSYDIDLTRKIIKEARRRACMAPCWSGLVDFAIPVVINGFVAAVFFTGQIRWTDSEGERALIKGSEKASKVVPLSKTKLLQLAEDMSQPKANKVLIDKLLEQCRIEVDRISDIATSRYWAERRARDSDFLTEIFAWFAAVALIESTDNFWKVLDAVMERVSEYCFFRYSAFLLKTESSQNSFFLKAKHGFKTPRSQVFQLTEKELDNLFEKETLVIVKEMGSVKDEVLYTAIIKLLNVVDVNCAFMIPCSSRRGFIILAERTTGEIFGQASAGRVSERRKRFLEKVGHEINIQVRNELFIEKLRTVVKERMESLQFTTHEINEPIQTIIAASEFLEESLPRALKVSYKKRDYCERILQNIRYAANTISFLNEGVRYLLEEKTELDIEPIDLLAEIMAPTARMLRLTIGRKVRVEYDKSAFKAIPIVYVDKNAILEMVYNLLGNAIKYANENSVVRIYPQADRKGWLIHFIDYGIGIPQGQEEWIFRIGTRAEEAIRRKFIGTGRGLFIARRIAELHGGDAKVTNNANPTVFTVSLPRKITRSDWHGKNNSSY